MSDRSRIHAAPANSQGSPPESAEDLDYTRMDDRLVQLAADVLGLAEEKGLTVVTAESCTGGLVACVLSEAPGAASQLQGGFVTYTKAQKTAALGVSADLLATKGAVCVEVARLMAEGALRASRADAAVAVTGVAGPSRDEDGNPVGRVCLSAVRRGREPIDVERHFGDVGRSDIRYRAAVEALNLLAEAISGMPPHAR
jgi:nicotinamide-nucleotide amidase